LSFKVKLNKLRSKSERYKNYKIKIKINKYQYKTIQNKLQLSISNLIKIKMKYQKYSQTYKKFKMNKKNIKMNKSEN
jgi:hypothetical protein